MNLKEKLKSEILETTWEPLVTHFAKGNTYILDKDLVLEEVGRAMAEDDVSQVKQWLDHGLLYPPTNEEATLFAEKSDMLFDMLIIEPYVLFQVKP
jgi:hypothetical protein